MIGVVLAGGASRRFGGRAKGLIELAGRPMVLHVANMLAKICTSVAIEAPAGAGYEALGLPLCHALASHAGKGPLAGIVAGLARGKPGDLIAFAPCDMPFLTAAIYEALGPARGGGLGAYASSPKGVEPLVAILDCAVRPPLLGALAHEPLARTHVVLDAAGARSVAFNDSAPFANINTPDDLASAEGDSRAARRARRISILS